MNLRPSIRLSAISPRISLALEFILYAVLTAFALYATWLTWPDAFIDFSRELYLPWRVSCGDVLYRDVTYYYGPVSVYTNAALFAILGRPSIHALFALNFAVWLAIFLALRAILRRIARPAVAAVALSAFILLFSFNRYIPCGNFNYLAPLSHELTRGLLYVLLSLLSLDSAFRRRSPLLFLFAGFLFGLALFAKPEITLSATASSSLLLFLGCGWMPPDGNGDRPAPLVRLRPLLPWALGILAALAAVLVPLTLALGSFSQALHDAILKLHLDCFRPGFASLPFYRSVTGMDTPLPNALRVLRGILVAPVPFLLARFALPRTHSRTSRIVAALVLLLLSAAIGLFGFFPLNAAIPLAPFVLLAFFLIPWWHARPAFLRRGRERSARVGDPPSPPGSPLAPAFAFFALALVAKMGLAASITFYGFILALPAFCCAILLAFRPPCPPLRSAVAVSMLLGFSITAMHLQNTVLRPWDIRHPIHDANYFAPPQQAQAFNAVLDWIRTNTPPGSTLAVFPEGAVLNVLADRPNPTPYCTLEEPGYLRFDASHILASYSNHPPDTIVLVQTAKPRFGIDYAQDLMTFFDSRYSPAFTFSLPSPAGPVPYLMVARPN